MTLFSQCLWAAMFILFGIGAIYLHIILRGLTVPFHLYSFHSWQPCLSGLA